MKVLIVDDEPSIRKIVRMALQRDGIEVAEAHGGAEAVARARDEKVDAILLDVLMPEPDGPQALQALRAHEETAAIPVIFLTALDEPSEVARLLALGAAAVLKKPFDPRHLAAQVRSALGLD